MLRRLRAAGWGLLAFAVVAVTVMVTVGALRAHGADAFNRWVGWATVMALLVAAVGIMPLLREKIAPDAASMAMSIGDVENELAAIVLAEAQLARSRLIGIDEAGDKAANVRFVKGSGRFREVGGTRESDLESALEYYQSLSPGRLVVLGEPGAGKTVLALELQVQLLELRQRDQTIPIPVLVTAAAYDIHMGWEEWLIRYLVQRFTLKVNTAARLVRNRRIVPLVDGIDEMDPAGEQERAQILVQKLNGWMSGREKAPLVVTCRSGKYEALTREVDRATHIEILPLTGEETAAYLEGQFLDSFEQRRWRPVLAALRADPVGALARQLATPWRLTLALAVFRSDGDPAWLLREAFPHAGEVAQYTRQVNRLLLGGYVTAVSRVHDPAGYYSPDEVSRWLAALADGLAWQARHGGSPTDIRLDFWWQTAGRRIIGLAHMTLLTIPPLLLALIFWSTSANYLLTCGAVCITLMAPIMTVGAGRMARPRQLRIRYIRTSRDLRTFSFSLVSALLVGLLAGLFARRMFPPGDEIIAFSGLFVAVFAISLVDISDGPLRAIGPRDVVREEGLVALVAGSGAALMGGFWFGALMVLLNELGPRHPYDPELGLACGLTLGPALGLIFALTVYGYNWTRYHIAVTIIAVRQRGPWGFGAFLEWAHQAGLLRVSGIAYQFRHRQLQDWLTSAMRHTGDYDEAGRPEQQAEGVKSQQRRWWRAVTDQQ